MVGEELPRIGRKGLGWFRTLHSEPVRNASQASPSEATPTRHYDCNIAQVKSSKAAMQTRTDVGDQLTS
jgi:hypothetical protein